MRRLLAPGTSAAGALLAWLIVGHGFANYDTAYALVWGSDLAHGRVPDYGVPLAPTPHPLANLAGLVLSPLGDGAETAIVVLGFVALGGLGWLAYALGAAWFGRAAGALAALIVLTREPILSFGARAYVDIPYLALVLGALLVETRRRRAGAPVLALLGLAGLLRPEAWLFSAAYLAWLAHARPRVDIVRLAALAAVAPLAWALSDWAIAGDPLHSLLGTRDTAATLGRKTGLQNVPLTAPRRLGEILREPVLVGAAGGGLIALLWWRERAWLAATAGFLSIGAFCVLALAGLPIIGRYLLLPAVLLAIFCGAGALGWLELDRGDPRRPRWMAFGALTLALLVGFAPAQEHRLSKLRTALGDQQLIRDDLHSLATAGLFRPSCAPVAVPNHRPVPLLALWLDRPPNRIVSAQSQRVTRGYYVDPASQFVLRNFVLDPHDPKQFVPRVPPGFELRARNRSWRVYARC